MTQFRDPILVADAMWRKEIEQRLGAIEARPQVIPPVPLVPKPVQALPSDDWYQPVTGASITAYWEAPVVRSSALAVWAVVPYRVPAGTTGALRLATISGHVSATYLLGDGTSGEVEFRWLHQAQIWTGDTLWIEAARTSGGGTVEIGHPSIAQVDPAGATAAGV